MKENTFLKFGDLVTFSCFNTKVGQISWATMLFKIDDTDNIQIKTFSLNKDDKPFYDCINNYLFKIVPVKKYEAYKDYKKCKNEMNEVKKKILLECANNEQISRNQIRLLNLQRKLEILALKLKSEKEENKLKYKSLKNTPVDCNSFFFLKHAFSKYYLSTTNKYVEMKFSKLFVVMTKKLSEHLMFKFNKNSVLNDNNGVPFYSDLEIFSKYKNFYLTIDFKDQNTVELEENEDVSKEVSSNIYIGVKNKCKWRIHLYQRNNYGNSQVLLNDIVIIQTTDNNGVVMPIESEKSPDKICLFEEIVNDPLDNPNNIYGTWEFHTVVSNYNTFISLKSSNIQNIYLKNVFFEKYIFNKLKIDKQNRVQKIKTYLVDNDNKEYESIMKNQKNIDLNSKGFYHDFRKINFNLKKVSDGSVRPRRSESSNADLSKNIECEFQYHEPLEMYTKFERDTFYVTFQKVILDKNEQESQNSPKISRKMELSLASTNEFKSISLTKASNDYMRNFKKIKYKLNQLLKIISIDNFGKFVVRSFKCIDYLFKNLVFNAPSIEILIFKEIDLDDLEIDKSIQNIFRQTGGIDFIFKFIETLEQKLLQPKSENQTPEEIFYEIKNLEKIHILSLYFLTLLEVIIRNNNENQLYIIKFLDSILKIILTKEKMLKDVERKYKNIIFCIISNYPQSMNTYLNLGIISENIEQVTDVNKKFNKFLEMLYFLYSIFINSRNSIEDLDYIFIELFINKFEDFILKIIYDEFQKKYCLITMNSMKIPLKVYNQQHEEIYCFQLYLQIIVLYTQNIYSKARYYLQNACYDYFLIFVRHLKVGDVSFELRDLFLKFIQNIFLNSYPNLNQKFLLNIVQKPKIENQEINYFNNLNFYLNEINIKEKINSNIAENASQVNYGSLDIKLMSKELWKIVLEYINKDDFYNKDVKYQENIFNCLISLIQNGFLKYNFQKTIIHENIFMIIKKTKSIDRALNRLINLLLRFEVSYNFNLFMNQKQVTNEIVDLDQSPEVKQNYSKEYIHDFILYFKKNSNFYTVLSQISDSLLFNQICKDYNNDFVGLFVTIKNIEDFITRKINNTIIISETIIKHFRLVIDIKIRMKDLIFANNFKGVNDVFENILMILNYNLLINCLKKGTIFQLFNNILNNENSTDEFQVLFHFLRDTTISSELQEVIFKTKFIKEILYIWNNKEFFQDRIISTLFFSLYLVIKDNPNNKKILWNKTKDLIGFVTISNPYLLFLNELLRDNKESASSVKTIEIFEQICIYLKEIDKSSIDYNVTYLILNIICNIFYSTSPQFYYIICQKRNLFDKLFEEISKTVKMAIEINKTNDDLLERVVTVLNEKFILYSLNSSLLRIHSKVLKKAAVYFDFVYEQTMNYEIEFFN